MTIDEINNRIKELEESVEILKDIRQGYINNNREEKYIRALNDGINYTSQRLEKYRTTEWIMAFE